MSAKKSNSRSTKKSRSGFLKRLALVCALLVLAPAFAALGFAYQAYTALQAPIAVSEPVLFDVRRGDSLKVLAERLESQEIIDSAFWFYWIGRYKKIDRQIKAGEYWLRPDYSEMGLYPLFISGHTAEYTITFIEGWKLTEILDEFQHHPKIVRTIDTQDPVALAELLEMKYPHAEGLIFPDTYAYHRGSTDVEILSRAYNKMLSTLEAAWANKADRAVVKSPYEALILASIIEKETSVDEEREIIAGVFTARLNKRMRLQTDPTVIYGLGESFTGNLTRAHLRQTTPYNTYRINGLPPTPIAMPGKASIEAALNPTLSGALYFVARGDGTHAFSKSLEEHNRAVREYQLNRRADYRSTK